MNNEQRKKTPYSESLSELIKISNDFLKTSNKKIKMIKIRNIIIICTTLVLTFTVLKTIIPLSLITSCLIDGFEIYKSKKQVNNIQKRKKAIEKINDFFNLEAELIKNNCASKSIMGNFFKRMEYSKDLYTCFQTEDSMFLKDITKKYTKNIESDLTILNNGNKQTNVKPISTTTNNSVNNIVYLPNNKEPINGYSYVKKIG